LVLSLREFMRSGRTLSYVLTLAMLTGLYSCLPMVKELSPYHQVGDTAPELHAALSLVVGWLLVFRTNTAHARWWEARTLWGSLINASRNLALKTSRLGAVPAEDRRRLRQLIADFALTLKLHLREEPVPKPMLASLGITGTVNHAPLAIASEIYRLMGDWKFKGQIDGDEMRVIDAEALRLMDICGGCERIQRTRIIRSYRVFARQCVMMFLLTLPWGIVQDFGWWTVPLTTLTAYFMLGMEIVAEHVEEPFGYDDDDLDLDGMCRTISQSVADVFDSAGE
jgi:ion channel-forming bestrophin family protein